MAIQLVVQVWGQGTRIMCCDMAVKHVTHAKSSIKCFLLCVEVPVVWMDGEE